MSYDEPYWLGRASEEQQRLIKQHYTWTKGIGYLLPPSIPPNLPANAKIADIGTGTGIWLSSLSAVSPATYTFDGYDISSAQFLPASSLPANVTLQLGDFKKPFPAHLHGKYDVVNIRLVIIAMGPGVWEATLKHVVELLKPGGAVCWTEGNFFVARGFRGAEVGSAGHALTRAQEQLNGELMRRFGYNWPRGGWRVLFEEVGGLVGVEEDVVSTDRLLELRREFTEVGAGAVFGALRNMARAKAKEKEKGDGGQEGERGTWDVDEVERWWGEAVRDMEEGAYLRWDIHVAVGFIKGGVKG